MWSFLGGLVGGAFKATVDWIMRSKQRADQIELGQRRQQVATHAADNAVIRKADDAAKKAAQEPFNAPDPNDLDRRQ